MVNQDAAERRALVGIGAYSAVVPIGCQARGFLFRVRETEVVVGFGGHGGVLDLLSIILCLPLCIGMSIIPKRSTEQGMGQSLASPHISRVHVWILEKEGMGEVMGEGMAKSSGGTTHPQYPQ